MSKNIQEIPFTEIVERVQELGRLPDNVLDKIRGITQDVYIREITKKYDWNFLFATSSLTTTARYNLGLATVNTGDTTVTFNADAVFDATFTGRRLKISGVAGEYTATFSNTTALTINPAFRHTSNISAQAYAVYQPVYTLAASFDRFPKNAGPYQWSGSTKQFLEFNYYQDWVRDYSTTPGIPARVIFSDADTAGAPRIELNPSPLTSINLHYDYIRKVRPLIQSTGLLIALSANQTTVLGLPGRSQFNDATTGDWIRVDELGKSSDSEWHRVIAIANNSSLTLAANFANTAITSSANYTLARAPEIPTELHTSIIHGSLKYLMSDQNDPQFQVYTALFAEALSDSKRIHVTRTQPQKVALIAEDFDYRR